MIDATCDCDRGPGLPDGPPADLVELAVAVDLFRSDPSTVLAELVDMEPGPLVLSILMAIDPARLSRADAVTWTQVHQHVASWWASMGTGALVAAADPAPRTDEYDVMASGDGRTVRITDAMREEVAAATRVAPATAQRRIDEARLLHGPLADTAQALALGEITTAHVAVMVEAVKRLPGYRQQTPTGTIGTAEFAAACREFQSRVLPVAKRATPGETRARARRVVEAIDAAGASRRRQEADLTRDVWVRDELDGISTLMARIGTCQAHAILTAIDATVRAGAIGTHPYERVHGTDGSEPCGDCDDRSAGQLRADALVDLVLAGCSGGGDGSASVAVELGVTIDATTLATLAAQAQALDEGGTPWPVEPPVVVGSDALTPVGGLLEFLFDHSGDVRMRRLVTDPVTGHLLDYGRSTYPIPDRLHAFLIGRDRTCRFPGCRRNAKACQLDHATAWDDGGATAASNLGALCVRHHQLKTVGGWHITESTSDGSCTWRSPDGRVHHHEPEPVAVAPPTPPPRHEPPPF